MVGGILIQWRRAKWIPCNSTQNLIEILSLYAILGPLLSAAPLD